MKLKIYNRYTDVSRMKIIVSDLFRLNDDIQTVESSNMKLNICNRYTDVSRMRIRVSNLFRFLTDEDNISIGRKNSESY